MDPSTSTPAIRHDELLEQMGWVQALARSLVRDPHVADDVAQEAITTALTRPPRTAHSGASLRAWLAAVTRTLARQSVRSETRRRGREEKAARPETAAVEADVLERGEVQRDLVAAVMELPDPYRSVVLLRYLDGLTGPEIAERTGVTPDAVRQRLSRGLKQLKSRLDARYGGDCRAWLMPLALPALAPKNGGSAAPAAGAPWAVPAVVGVGASLIVGAVLVMAPWRDETGVPSAVVLQPTQAQPAALPQASPRGAVAALPPAVDSARLDGDARPVPDAIGLAPVLTRLTGRVVDSGGAPVADLRMRFEPSSPPARGGGLTHTAFSDGAGRFTIEGPDDRGRVLAASSRWVTLLAGDADRSLGGGELVVVVCPAAPLSGRVVDPSGAPVPGARVRLAPPDDLEARLSADLARSWPLSWETLSDAGGRFDLARAPRAPGTRVEVDAVGFRPWTRPLPPSPGDAVTVVLERPAARLAGRVVDGAGAPVAGARVAFGAHGLSTDGHGDFTLHLEPEQLTGAEAPRELRAGSERHQPVVVPAPLDPADGTPAWPLHLTITLGPPAATFTGRVVDDRGEPVHGARVWLTDPTPLLVEDLFDDGDVELLRAPPGSAGTAAGVVTAEQLMGAHDRPLLMVSTDIDGAFTLEGVADRPYVLAAMLPGSLLMTTSMPRAPGDGPVRLQLPGAAGLRSIDGQVMDHDGLPIEGAHVSLRRPMLTIAHTTWWESGRTTSTDAQGRFSLNALDSAGSWLRVDGPELTVVDMPVPPADDGPVTIRVPGRRALRVLLDDSQVADAVQVLDAAGAPLPLTELRRDRRLSLDTVPLQHGRSPLLGTSTDAVTLLLWRDGQVVDRRPLQLPADRVLEIH